MAGQVLTAATAATAPIRLTRATGHVLGASLRVFALVIAVVFALMMASVAGFAAIMVAAGA